MTRLSKREQRGSNPSQRAAQLVGDLQNLIRGPLVLPEIIALGECAIPALEVALRAPSQALAQPRALAADALGAIGGERADATLTRALEDSTGRLLDPSFREAEAVVVSRIVTHLSRHARHEATDALLDSLRQRPAAACAEALGELLEPRAIPLLVKSLGEDAARESAMEALRRFGRAPILGLRAALACPQSTDGIEPPTNIDARAAAATLLAELGERTPLLVALQDPMRAVRVAAAMGLAHNTGDAPTLAFEILVQALDEPNWTLAESIMTALTHRRASCEQLLESAFRDIGEEEETLRRRRRAALLAGRWGIACAAPILASFADSPDPLLRFAVIHALPQVPSATDEQIALFLADSVLGIALEAARALELRHPVTMHDLSAHLKRSRSFRSPWRRWQRLWALRAKNA